MSGHFQIKVNLRDGWPPEKSGGCLFLYNKPNMGWKVTVKMAKKYTKINKVIDGFKLSPGRIATLLGLHTHKGPTRVLEMQRGYKEASGPIDVVCEYLLQSLPSEDVPKYIFGEAVDREDEQWMVRLCYPRFLGKITQKDTLYTDDWYGDIDESLAIKIVRWIDNPKAMDEVDVYRVLDEAGDEWRKSVAWIDLKTS